MMGAAGSNRPLVAVAGASGFVGSHLRRALDPDFRFRALTRSSSIAARRSVDSSTEWRLCDLYSLPKVSDALQGCEYGFYLVHSMAPSSRLTQASFEDTDLLLADNFIRAAEEAGLKHVIYLSGLMPNSGDLSPHLRSRKEVETVLRSRSIPVTVLRAGLIFGPGGSSFSMLINLVRRLPVMLLPQWVRSTTQSIDIQNVCEAFRLCLTDSSLQGGIYDLGGHEPMSYRQMIKKTADSLGRKIWMIHFPANCFSLSKHWVAFFGKVPTALVGPLQESLQHDLRADSNVLLDQLQAGFVPLEESFKRAVDAEGRPKPNPRNETQSSDTRQIRRQRLVRSVQRMSLPPGWDAEQTAEAYGNWLTQKFGGVINVLRDDSGVLRFNVFKNGPTLLELEPTPYTLENKRRRAFYISGGLLSRKVDPPGRFEFRLFPENSCLIASIHGYAPVLPWFIYVITQARIHLRVMNAFGRHLRQLSSSGQS
ncbi:MAG: NAD(P)H-binding protein [Verrucomicrobiota bacterium]